MNVRNLHQSDLLAAVVVTGAMHALEKMSPAARPMPTVEERTGSAIPYGLRCAELFPSETAAQLRALAETPEKWPSVHATRETYLEAATLVEGR